MMIPCDCGALDQIEANTRVDQARIPKRFENRTFQSFRTNDPMREALKQASMSYSKSFSEREDRGLILRGVTGAGKTHLAIAILRAVIDRGFSGLYYNVNDLLSELRSSYSANTDLTEGNLLEDVNKADLLVFDDLGAESPTDWVCDRLYLIINRRYEVARPTIITTNCSDGELRDRLGNRIASRLYEMCMPIGDFPREDYRFSNLR